MSVLKWIWGLLRKLFAAVDFFIRFFLQILQSLLTWVIMGLTWLIHLVFEYIGDFFYDVFSNIQSVSIPTIPYYHFAVWLGKDLLALNIAWECVIIFFSAWVATRVARASFAAVRVILDLL